MLKTLPVSLSEKYFQNTCWITYCCQLLVITERLVNLEHLSVSINNNHTSDKAYWLWYYQSGLPRWFSGKESTYQYRSTEDIDSVPGLGRSPGGRNDNPLQRSCLENPMDRRLAGYSPRGRKAELQGNPEFCAWNGLSRSWWRCTCQSRRIKHFI